MSKKSRASGIFFCVCGKEMCRIFKNMFTNLRMYDIIYSRRNRIKQPFSLAKYTFLFYDKNVCSLFVYFTQV